MLRTYSKNINVNAGEAIPFNINKIDNVRNESHQEASPSITLNRPGYYDVYCDISFTTQSEETNPLSVQLYANGVAIPDAIITVNVGSTSTYVDSSFGTIIKANPGTPLQKVSLTVVPTANITISSISITVNKVI